MTDGLTVGVLAVAQVALHRIPLCFAATPG
ncbi:hypothetical protein PCA20602_00214 [Pandoraea capi]|uniref:Uncharacterized protein n=1 Tax=Pandoraea capi TaxID=2508286 RepID=A0ABY6VLV0_9BURK|nr:hypothetical protein PCA20602_00214 [Pandoraea capi]